MGSQQENIYTYIVNNESNTVAEAAGGDNALVVGYKLLPERIENQKWTLEKADQPDLFYIKTGPKADSGTGQGPFYLNIDGKPVVGAVIITTKGPGQKWRIRFEDPVLNTFKILYPGAHPEGELAVNLSYGSSASGAPLILWGPPDEQKQDHQRWKFVRIEPPSPFEFHRPYVIVNSKTGTVAQLKDNQNNTDIGAYLLAEYAKRERQEWTFEKADEKQNNSFFIKSSAGSYLAVKEVKTGASIIHTSDSKNKGHWYWEADKRDPTKFSIYLRESRESGSKFLLDLDRGVATPGAKIQLWDPKSETSDPDNQHWKFVLSTADPELAVNLQNEAEVASQYYDDIYFPEDSIWKAWVKVNPKSEELFFPTRENNEEYNSPILVKNTHVLQISGQDDIKKLSNQEVWIRGDWRFAVFQISGKPQKGRILYNDAKYVQNQ
ncbi:uncharacterized protein EI90DRAFT_3048746 [Cantharellus anzutake]|uniref:uncharacterized protein n=1 Tax=Cantharellus anzutake TaxID=1750568 RepID=UPI0019066908|nr:uncharacterized protein EI90DRAFT_3048746 [Cantharellus anzutake]KAF8334889.1 hypothetical protein EI90DRAFT_3048746 [Cantharellus anzutake]